VHDPAERVLLLQFSMKVGLTEPWVSPHGQTRGPGEPQVRMRIGSVSVVIGIKRTAVTPAINILAESGHEFGKRVLSPVNGWLNE